MKKGPLLLLRLGKGSHSLWLRICGDARAFLLYFLLASDGYIIGKHFGEISKYTVVHCMYILNLGAQ